MPPNLVKSKNDEKMWKKAKAQAAKEGHAKNWPYIVSIFMTMTHKNRRK